MHQVSEDTYKTLIKLTQGRFNKSKKDRNLAERNAVVLFWRRKQDLTIHKIDNENKLFFRGKPVLIKSDFKKTVLKKSKESKGAGARSVHYLLKGQFAGSSEKRVLRILKRNRNYGQLNAKFTNKAPLKTVRSSEVFQRLQVDLINMREDAVKYNGKTYRYILSAVDVFSRFVFLRAIERKTSKSVAKEMQSIFKEHGYPAVVQCDNGTEFLGSVQKLLDDNHVKVVKGRPYHPQSQGKVERQNRTIRNKIRYDITKRGSKGYNWAECLPSVASAMNNVPKEVLGYQTPLSVYFGRSKDKCSADAIRRKANIASDRCFRRQSIRFTKQYGCAIYQKHDNVLIKYPLRKSRVPQKQSVLKGKVLKRDKLYRKCYVEFEDPHGQISKKWIPVENLTSLTKEEEIKRRKDSIKIFTELEKRRQHREKYYIPNIPTERNNGDVDESCNQNSNVNREREDEHSSVSVDEDRFFAGNVGRVVIVKDPTAYGNCQFDAAASQLEKIGIHRTGKQLRQIAVDHIRNNRHQYEEFVIGRGGLNAYMTRMAKNTTYGDHLTLQALAAEFFCQFFICSSFGGNHHRLVSQTNIFDSNVPLLTLGYYPDGEHYVSIEIEPTYLYGLIDILPSAEDANEEFFPQPENVTGESDDPRFCENDEFQNSDHESEGICSSNKSQHLSNNDSDDSYRSQDDPKHESNDNMSSTRSHQLDSEDSYDSAVSFEWRNDRMDDSEVSSSSNMSPPCSGDDPNSFDSSDRERGDDPKNDSECTISVNMDDNLQSESDVIVSDSDQDIAEENISIHESSHEHFLPQVNDPTRPALPDLVLSNIVRLSVESDPMMVFTLQNVCQYFRHIVRRYGYPRLHLDNSFRNVLPVTSVRRLIRTYGRNSGVVVRVREILQNTGPRWVNAWLWLEHIDLNWYEVQDVSWRT